MKNWRDHDENEFSGKENLGLLSLPIYISFIALTFLAILVHSTAMRLVAILTTRLRSALTSHTRGDMEEGQASLS